MLGHSVPNLPIEAILAASPLLPDRGVELAPDHPLLRHFRWRLGVEPMAIDDQMRWQFRFLDAALGCVARATPRAT